jgi:cation:H+ antiporter
MRPVTAASGASAPAAPAAPTIVPPPSRSHPGRQRLAILLAVLVTTPGLALRLSGSHPPELLAAVLFGVAIIGAAFVLAWGAEVVQLDVSQGLALALLALIAVLPEYAVDFVFTWKAGQDPEEFAPLALANMTGANRLLIGVGWSMVVLLAAWRMRRIAGHAHYRGSLDTEVRLERSHAIEISFLSIACVFSLILPLFETLTLWHSAVLVTIFVLYSIRIARAPAEEPHLVGPAQLIGKFPQTRRRAAVVVMFVFAAGVILACAEPFAEALVDTGESFGISTFLLVQWLAPLASEAPELLVAGLFAWRLNTNAALGALVSSKVNQWTLLVGTLPIVFAISSSSLHGLPIDSLQREELFLTAAQGVFAVAVLANRSIGVKEALALFGLFFGQFLLGGVLPEDLRSLERVGIGILYLVLAAGMLVKQRHYLRPLMRDGLRTPVHELIHDDDGPAKTEPLLR